MRVYRVLSCIESIFSGIREARDFVVKNDIVLPRVPKTVMVGEDEVTPRICVCAKLIDCFTAIGLIGNFRRCLGHNEGMFSYALRGLEAYPIIVQTFDVDTVYNPTADDVPDAHLTKELWLLKATKPRSTCLMWLNMFSITVAYEEIDGGELLKCVDVSMMDDQAMAKSILHHPWVDGLGHVMDSSEPEENYDEM